jgi:hypothetical protein
MRVSSDAVESGDDSDEERGTAGEREEVRGATEVEESAGDSGDGGVGAAEGREELLAQVELLAAENRRLREEYVRSRLTTHRRTALGLFAVGALAALGGLALPGSRTVLFALGGTGLFAGLLTYYLTPEQFVAAGTGERVYASLAATGAELVGELGLQDDRVYAPANGTAEFGGVRLFVPQQPDYAVPAADDLDSLFVVSDHDRARGVALPPSGGALFREFETGMTDEVSEAPEDLAVQLADALAEGFELVETAAADADPDGGRATAEVAGSVYGSVDRFDHPVASFFAVGLTATLDAPVRAAVTPDEDGPADYFVTCEWDPEDVASVEEAGDVEQADGVDDV